MKIGPLVSIAMLVIAGCASMRVNHERLVAFGSDVGNRAYPVAPPPPPIVISEPFYVFFDSGKTNLTVEAQAVIHEAALAIRESNSSRVLITGHTDRAEAASEPADLSQRRGVAVKVELIRLGVTEGVISTRGHGDQEPMVNTAPGVREPQNRRAVIEIGR